LAFLLNYQLIKVQSINNESIALIVGRRVREIRKEKGFTIEGLANEANIEYSQLSRIELGKINTTLAQLQIIANALEVKLTYLLKEL
jgi:transcriptional regulator with XRE-family HTH domain